MVEVSWPFGTKWKYTPDIYNHRRLREHYLTSCALALGGRSQGSVGNHGCGTQQGWSLGSSPSQFRFWSNLSCFVSSFVKIGMVSHNSMQCFRVFLTESSSKKILYIITCTHVVIPHMFLGLYLYMYKHIYVTRLTHTVYGTLILKCWWNWFPDPIKDNGPWLKTLYKDSVSFRLYYWNDSTTLVVQLASVYWAAIMYLCEQNWQPLDFCCL